MTAWLRRCPRLAGLLVAVAPLYSGAAVAQPVAPPDIRCAVEAPQPCMVVTRGGAIYVGQLTALFPDQPLVIRLLTREERVVPWAEVSSALPTAPVAKPTSGYASASLHETPVLATVQGLRPQMRIEQRARGLSEDAPWGTVCRYPCAPLALPPGYDYRLIDPNVSGTPEFEVPSDASAVRLRIQPGHAGRRGPGLGLLIVGSILTAAVLPTAYLYLPSLSSASSDQRLAWQISLGVLGALGVSGIAAGTALFVTGSTRAELTPLLSRTRQEDSSD